MVQRMLVSLLGVGKRFEVMHWEEEPAASVCGYIIVSEKEEDE